MYISCFTELLLRIRVNLRQGGFLVLSITVTPVLVLSLTICISIIEYVRCFLFLETIDLNCEPLQSCVYFIILDPALYRYIYTVTYMKSV